MREQPFSPEVEEGLRELEEEIETDLFLLGATALEDKLQEGVAEAICDFREAEIKVWMLTGDKMETAQNIGYSCKMFEPSTLILEIKKEHNTM